MKELFSQTFPELSEAEWDSLCRSNAERLKGARMSDGEWDSYRAMTELSAARVKENYADNKTTHYLEPDAPHSDGFRLWAPVEESKQYYSLKYWSVTGVYGAYLVMQRKAPKERK